MSMLNRSFARLLMMRVSSHVEGVLLGFRISDSGGLCGFSLGGGASGMGREDAVAHGHRVVTVHFHVASSNRPKFMYLCSVLYVLGAMRVHNLCNGGVSRKGIT